ncbi:hypothetical protein CGLO_01584 [Colletotrichum gloeosporioides Cg-14]|uniref:Uncharacterized protein n=1 Tax=Colletotrichum gloeosporioides (strain Cg-14) TaxID=1237896 RepID=T0MB55_COLGC|nr:hypothetical protein CGLO_01584 [Colletotrichum gloeosporioides Cg-14]
MPSGSNTGPEASWSITQSECVMCANVVSAAFGISMTAVKGGDLIINVTWQDCVVGAELGEAFVANLERWLTSGEVLALRRLGAELLVTQFSKEVVAWQARDEAMHNWV